MGNNLKVKYIVYETTNLINNKIYVGVHHTTTPYEFDKYLGCGVISTQPYTYENAKTCFQYAVKKYGPKNFRRKTLAVFNTIEEAFALEREIVNEEFVAREDTYNMILGGFTGKYESERKKVFQYSIEGKFLNEYVSFYEAGTAIGKDQSSISYAVKYKSKCGGFLWSTDKVDNVDITLYKIKDNGRIEIHTYDKNGSLLNSYISLKEASKKMHLSPESIRDALHSGLLIKDTYYISTEKAPRFDLARKLYLENRTVYKYDSDSGVFLEKYDTQKEAEAKNPKSNISKSIRLKEDDGNGFKWALIKHDTYGSVGNRHPKKMVYKYDLNNNLIQIFESATLAAKTDGIGVWNVLRQKSKTYKQHIYTYNKVSEIV